MSRTRRWQRRFCERRPWPKVPGLFAHCWNLRREDEEIMRCKYQFTHYRGLIVERKGNHGMISTPKIRTEAKTVSSLLIDSIFCESNFGNRVWLVILSKTSRIHFGQIEDERKLSFCPNRISCTTSLGRRDKVKS